jgi:hypothetical protein
MNAQRRVTAPPVSMAEVVTSSLRMEVLDGNSFIGFSSAPVNFRRGFASEITEMSARETCPARNACWMTELPFRLQASLYPRLSGTPGTGAVSF